METNATNSNAKKSKTLSLKASAKNIANTTKAMDKTLQKTLAISLQTYVQAITSAAISSKYALNLELSVGLAVFSESGLVTRNSKRALSDIYKDAGYDCSDANSPDYKTVQRRISVAGELFNFIGATKVDEWIEGNAEMAIINSISKNLEPLQLKSINGVLALVGKPVVAKAIAAPEKKQEAPKTTDDVSTQMTQAMDEALKKAKKSSGKEMKHISFNGVEIDVPLSASRDEVFGAAMELLKYGETLAPAQEKEALKERRAVVH